MQGSYNAKDFGAVGDGIADDTLAIRSAVHVLFNSGFGVLEIPPGNYRILEPIIIRPRSHVTRTILILGYGAWLFYESVGICFDINNIHGVEIRDIIIKGLGFRGGRESSLLRLRSPETGGGNLYRWKLQDLIFTNVSGHGINIEGNTFEGVIDNCRMTAMTSNVSGYGLYIHATVPGKISSIDIYNCNTRGFRHGLYSDPASDLDVFGGTYLQAQMEGVYVNIQGGSLTGVHVENNWRSVSQQSFGGAGVRAIGWGSVTSLRSSPESNQKYGLHIYANSHPFTVIGHGFSGAGGTYLATDGSVNSSIVTIGVKASEITHLSENPVVTSY